MGEKMDVMTKIYREIIGKDFIWNDARSRENMQHIVYMLQAKGLNLGGYKFEMVGESPYSFGLAGDMAECSMNNKYRFSDETYKALKRMRKTLDKCGDKSKMIKRMATKYYLMSEMGYDADQCGEYFEKHCL